VKSGGKRGKRSNVLFILLWEKEAWDIESPWLRDGLQAYVNEANERLAIVLQVEHKEAVQNIRSILQVPRIGAMMIGPLDLSASLGVLGQIQQPTGSGCD